MNPADLSASLSSALGTQALRVFDERDLQEQLSQAATRAGIEHRREARVGGKLDRPDFLIDGVAVEVKVGGSYNALLRQIFRYAAHPDVIGILVVTTRRTHDRLPDLILDKPVATLCLGDRLW